MFCKDCKHFKHHEIWISEYNRVDACARNTLPPNLIDGKTYATLVRCGAERRKRSLMDKLKRRDRCGIEGKFWHPSAKFLANQETSIDARV